MNRHNNERLLRLSATWRLDGDWMECRECRRSLVASRDGEPLLHKSLVAGSLAACTRGKSFVTHWGRLRRKTRATHKEVPVALPHRRDAAG